MRICGVFFKQKGTYSGDTQAYSQGLCKREGPGSFRSSPVKTVKSKSPVVSDVGLKKAKLRTVVRTSSKQGILVLERRVNTVSLHELTGSANWKAHATHAEHAQVSVLVELATVSHYSWKYPLLLLLHSLPSSQGQRFFMLQGCDCRCPWRKWLVYRGKDCNIWSGKPSHARKHIPRTQMHSTSMIACFRDQSALLHWGDASWVAVTFHAGTSQIYVLKTQEDKIEALLGATQQVVSQGQQIPVSLPSGTEESITGLGWQLIRRGSVWHAYQELDTKPSSVYLSPSRSKWEDVCSGIREIPQVWLLFPDYSPT